MPQLNLNNLAKTKLMHTGQFSYIRKMSYRLFEGKEHAKIYSEMRPTPPRSLINTILDYLSQGMRCDRLEKAVDLGCGSGQCTFALANHFEHVLGTDISAAQISEAWKAAYAQNVKNVEFKVSTGEAIPAEDNSVQLITICTAAHFMKLDKIYEEGRRVLMPKGVLALLSSNIPNFTLMDVDKEKNVQFQILVDAVKERLTAYRSSAGKTYVQNEYRDIVIPYEENTRGFNYLSKREISLNGVCQMMQSWSPYHVLAAAEGKEAARDLIANFKTKVQQMLNPEGVLTLENSNLIRAEIPYFFVMARV